MKSLHKYFFLLLLVLLLATHSKASESLVILDIKVQEAPLEYPLRPPQKINIPYPYRETTYVPSSLYCGEEVVITVENPDNEFHNGNIDNGKWDQDKAIQDKAIHCEMEVNNYNTYENWWYDRRPLETISLSNRNPLAFRYKAIRTGSVRLSITYQRQMNAVDIKGYPPNANSIAAVTFSTIKSAPQSQ